MITEKLGASINMNIPNNINIPKFVLNLEEGDEMLVHLIPKQEDIWITFESYDYFNIWFSYAAKDENGQYFMCRSFLRLDFYNFNWFAYDSVNKKENNTKFLE